MHKQSNLVVLGGLTFATVAAGVALVNPGAEAAQQATAHASVTVQSTCSMTATVNTAHNATLFSGTYSGSSYPDGIGKTTIQTFCNDLNGYSIYAIGYTNNELGNTVLKGTDLSSEYDIVTGTATSGSVSNDVSNWAMKISAVSGTYAPTIVNGFGSFSAVPSSYTKVATLTSATDSSEGTNIGSSIETTYAAYIARLQPAGTYSGQVRYALVHPSSPETQSDYVLQNIAEWENELLPGVQYSATDARDGSVYTVSLLKDGKIWLLDNLALDLTDPTVKANLSAANTNASDTTLSYLKGTISRDPATDASGNYAISGVASWAGVNSYSDPLIATSGASWTKDTTQPLAMGQSGTGKIGIYYNFCAASAGSYCYGDGTSYDYGISSGNATEDICPAGWRMPTGSNAGEYKALLTAYSNDKAAFVNALRTALSGSYRGNSASDQGSDGRFWSSTRTSNSNMSRLVVTSSNVEPLSVYNRNYGYPVRCVSNLGTPYTVDIVTTNGSSVVIDGISYSNGSSVSLLYNSTHTISGSYATDYEFDSWATSGNVSVASTSSASTTLTVTGAGTLTLNEKQNCTPTISGYMQNASLVTNYCTRATGTVTDSRDGETYSVARLADGNVWLLDNLRLDLTNATVKSNLTASTTNASDTTLNYLKNGGGTTSDQYAITGVVEWTSSPNYASSYSYSDPLIATSGTGNNGSWTKDTLQSYGSGSGKIGVYYNYCAASAGSYCYGNGTSQGSPSGNATEDICPKGWYMPTGDYLGEYQALYAAYSSNATSFNNALRTPLSGGFDDGSAYNQGSVGFLWSSTYSTSNRMCGLYVDSSDAYPQCSTSGRGGGNSVRCLFEPFTPHTIYYDKNTTDTVSDLPSTWNGTINTAHRPILSATTPTRAAYDFIGWCDTLPTASGDTDTCSGVTYMPGSDVLPASGSSTTVYAMWQKTESKLFFQDATSAQCGQIMYDNRGTDAYKNIAYTTASINGLCWMTRNLDLPGGTTITPANSNVSSDYTLPASSTSGFDDTDTAYVYNSNRTICGYNSPCYSYYSYAAATAGTNPSSGEATSDICPKGWRLPTRAEYNALINTYTTGAALTAPPFYIVYAGYYSYSSFYEGGSRGFYWSSTTAPAYYWPSAYALELDSTDYPAEVDPDHCRSDGYPVRCVAK